MPEPTTVATLETAHGRARLTHLRYSDLLAGEINECDLKTGGCFPVDLNTPEERAALRTWAEAVLTLLDQTEPTAD